jgi:hypothetical protein
MKVRSGNSVAFLRSHIVAGLLVWPIIVGTEAAAKSLPEKWTNKLIRVHEKLLAEDWRPAEKETKRLLREMTDSIVTGPDVGQLLARTAIMRALALAGQERKDEALWQWHVACQLFPNFAKTDLSRYGASGELLQSHPPREPSLSECKIRQVADDDCDATIVEPKIRSRPQPKFPRAQASRVEKVVVVAEAIIGKDGHVRWPALVATEGELPFVYAVFEAMQRWEFEPALKDGEPVSVYFTLTVTFKGKR